MVEVYQARTIAVTVRRDWREVYAFSADPAHWPRWAAGLGASFAQSGDEWTADDPEGRPIRITFAEPNSFGVLDHVVRDADDRETPNAFRVVPNGAGAELLFTVLRMHDATREDFEADCAAVERDLNSLRELLETGTSQPHRDEPILDPAPPAQRPCGADRQHRPA